MNTKSNNTAITNEIRVLKDVVPFGIMLGALFVKIENLEIDEKGRLCCSQGNEIISVSSLINTVKQLQTSRWLNHLYFIDGFGKKILFKNYISKKYNLKFT
jgi:hypothetical protein